MTNPDVLSEVRVEEVHAVTADVVAGLADLSEVMLRAKAAPTEQELADLLASPATRLLIARDANDLIIGTLTLVTYQLPSGRRYVIEDVAILRFAGRRGLGSALLAEALRLIEEAGGDECECLVDPGQAPAVRLFERAGFQRMATGLAYQKRF